MPTTPEGFVLDAVCHYLYVKKYSFWRQNTGGIYDTTRQSWRTMSRFAMKGVSDIILVHKGVTHFIEVKSATGKLSPDQKEFRDMIEAAGCKYYVVRSIDDLIAAGFK